MIMFAVAALAVVTPLAIVSHATSDSSIEKDVACAEADSTGGTIDSIFQQAAPAGGQDIDDSYTPSVAVIVQTIDLSKPADSYIGVTYDGTNLTFDPTGNAYYYDVIQTNKAADFRGKIIFAPGTDLDVTINGISTASNIELQGNASLRLLLADFSTIDAGILVPEGAAIVIDSAALSGGSDGTLMAMGYYYDAGIGGAFNKGGNAGTITINGGTVRVSGGIGAAGIGAAGFGSFAGTITINGGTVYASGGAGAAGIGGGGRGIVATSVDIGSDVSKDAIAIGGYITINGGNVTATGGSSPGGAGIGAGHDGADVVVAIDSAANVKAYSRYRTAIQTYGSGNNGDGYYVNAYFTTVSFSDVMIYVYCDGSDAVIDTLILPPYCTGFAFTTGSTTAADYNLRALIRDFFYPIVTAAGGLSQIRSVSDDSALQVVMRENIPVTDVVLYQETMTLEVGETGSLTAVVCPEDATNRSVSWTSSDDTVVSVDAYGYIVALKAGTATITVTTNDGGFTAECTVTVPDQYTYWFYLDFGIYADEARPNRWVSTRINGNPMEGLNSALTERGIYYESHDGYITNIFWFSPIWDDINREMWALWSWNPAKGGWYLSETGLTEAEGTFFYLGISKWDENHNAYQGPNVNNKWMGTDPFAYWTTTIDLSDPTGNYPGVTWNGTDLTFDQTYVTYPYEIIQTNGADAFTGKIIFSSGTNSNVTIRGVKTNNTIVLQDDASLKLLLAGINNVGGILVPDSAAIIIDSAALSGSINGTMTSASSDWSGAGIGGAYHDDCGTITINGGTVIAIGGAYAAGIGCGDRYGYGGTITINGGNVTATGGDWGGAGIGGGYNGAGGTITINGGSVTATGNVNSAGIGGGYYGSNGTVIINGGIVNAKGDSAGIGAGGWGDGGTITINGGSVTATGGPGGTGIGTSNPASGASLAVLTIDRAAYVKAYSDGRPAIQVDESGNNGNGYYLNASFETPISDSLVAIAVCTDGYNNAVIDTLILPAGYTGFAYATGATSAEKYNLYATISDVSYEIVTVSDNLRQIPSVNDNSVLRVMLKGDVAASGVTLDKESIILVLEENESETLTATVSPANATDKSVTWSSSNTAVATVDENGMVTAVSVGDTMIIVTTKDGGFTATCTVTVTLIFIDYAVFLDKNEMTLEVGENGILTATVAMPDWMDKSVTWSSSDKSVATVDSDGLVTAVGDGTATITVTTVEGNLRDTCTVTVLYIVHVTGVEIDKHEMTLATGGTGKITATVSPSGVTDNSVTWFSMDESVATVDSSGLVTAVGYGTTGIFVRTIDGGFMDVCIVTVPTLNVPATGVTLDKGLINLGVGDTEKITAKISPSDATNKNVKWSSSNKAVATIDENGVVTAVGVGQVTISVTTADGGYKAFCTVKVVAYEARATSVALDKDSVTVLLYGTEKLTATISPANATNKNVTWSSDNRMVVNVDATGKLTGITTGTATITVTTNDGGYTAKCVVTVVRSMGPVVNVLADESSMILTEGDTKKITAM